MKGKTVFVLPCESQLTIEGILNIRPGEEVMIDDASFGTSLRKCEVISHHFVKERNSHQYIRRVFLL